MQELNPIQQSDQYLTYVEACASGHYCGIPLHYRNATYPTDLHSALEDLKTNPTTIEYWENTYTWSHYGEEAHRWRIIGYQSFEETDFKNGLIKLYFEPVYPEIFQSEHELEKQERLDLQNKEYQSVN